MGCLLVDLPLTSFKGPRLWVGRRSRPSGPLCPDLRLRTMRKAATAAEMSARPTTPPTTPA